MVLEGLFGLHAKMRLLRRTFHLPYMHIQTSGNDEVQCTTPSSLSVSNSFRAYVLVCYLPCAFSFEIYFGTGQSKIERPVWIVLWL